jgi:hypothetical protein
MQHANRAAADEEAKIGDPATADGHAGEASRRKSKALRTPSLSLSVPQAQVMGVMKVKVAVYRESRHPSPPGMCSTTPIAQSDKFSSWRRSTPRMQVSMRSSSPSLPMQAGRGELPMRADSISCSRSLRALSLGIRLRLCSPLKWLLSTMPP